MNPAVRQSGEPDVAPTLHELHAVLVSIVENSDDAIIGKMLDGTVTTWNRAAEKLFGYSRDEMVGRNILVLIPPDRIGEERFIIDRLKRGEIIDHYQSRRLSKTGELIDVALTVSPIRDVNGTIVGASKIVRDISKAELAAKAVRESEARFRQLADSMPQIVWQATPDGMIDYCNRRWYEFTGLPKESVQLQDESGWGAVVHPDDLQPTIERFYSAVRAGVPHIHEARFRDGRSGEYRWHLVRGLPVRDEAGKIVRWFGTSTDVHDLKQAQSQKFQAQERAKEQQAALAHLERVRTMGHMASGLAHELNQPLGAILNYGVVLKGLLSKLQCDDPALSKAQEIVDDVIAQASRAGEIVRRMRGFVKKQEPIARPRDLNELVYETVHILSFDLRVAGVTPQLSLADRLPPVLVDGVQIQQVLVNLVRNAIDAMADRSAGDRKLIISSDVDERGHVRVSVEDNGCGITAEIRDRIFDSFFTTKTHGLGMGLSLCRTIIEEHGGQLLVKQAAPGGTIFSFLLHACSFDTARCITDSSTVQTALSADERSGARLK